MISTEDKKEFNSSTDEDVQFDIAEKYGFSTLAQFRKALREQESKNSTKSTPQIKKEEERSTEIENAPTKSEQKKLESAQRGEDLLGKTVSINIDDIANAYAPNNEQVKSLIKLQPSNNYGGAMTRLIVGSDNNNKPIYETNQEYIDRNNAAFKSMGLDWSNKSDRALVAKELEDTEVKKSKKDIKEGKGEGFGNRLVRYGADIVFPRTVEEIDRREDDPNYTEDPTKNIDTGIDPLDYFIKHGSNYPLKDMTADAAENIIQTVASPVTGPLKAVGRLAPKAARVVSKVPGWVGTRILDNLGDVVASEAIDNAIYDDNDPSNPRSDWSGKDIALGGTVNVVAPYMLDRQTGRLGRRLDIGSKNLLNKVQGGGVTSRQLRDEADKLDKDFDKVIEIRNSIFNDYAKPYGGWDNTPSKMKAQANSDLNKRLRKAGPDVDNAYRGMYNLDSDIPITKSVPTSFSDIDDKYFDNIIQTPDQLRKKADYVDYLNEGYMPLPVVGKDGKVKRPYKIKKDKNATGVDEKGNIVDIYGMPIDDLPPVEMKEALKKDAIVYKTKPKSIFTVLTSDLPDVPTDFRNRKPRIKQYSDLPRTESYDPKLDVKDRAEGFIDKSVSGLLDRGLTWLPNKTGKSEMITSMLPVELLPTDEELEEQSLIDSAPTLRTTEPTNKSSKNLFSALNEEDPNNEDEDEEDPYDISFMPMSNRYIKKAGK